MLHDRPPAGKLRDALVTGNARGAVMAARRTVQEAGTPRARLMASGKSLRGVGCDQMNVAIIANPVSGRRLGRGAAEVAARVFADAGWEADVRFTAGPGDATRLAREAAAEGMDAVFAAGGDGTLSQVLTGLLDTSVPAGLIPAGTGNDLARTLGLSLDPRAAARQALEGHAEPVDLMRLNDGAQWAVNVLGVGFDARVAVRCNRRSRLLGGLPAYLLSVAGELVSFRTTQLRLEVDAEAWEGPMLLCAIANATSYGAGMRIAPQAHIDDGLLDVVLVRPLSRLGFLRAFPQVFRGAHLNHPAVQVFRGREVRLLTEEPEPVNVDGDILGSTPLKVEVAAGRGLVWLSGRG
jgi:diacylglycerol kinase (ATP)